jgi:hypothetical protein
MPDREEQSTMGLRTLSPLLAAATLALSACGGDDSGTAGQEATATGPGLDNRVQGGQAPKTTDEIRDGQTTLVLEGDAVTLLADAGVRFEALEPAQESPGEIRLPISGGTLDVAAENGEVRHDGGLRIVADGSSVEATDLVVDPDARNVTASIDGQEVELLVFDTSTPRVPQEGAVSVLQVDVLLGDRQVIAEALGVRLPAEDIKIGRLVVSANRPQPDAGRSDDGSAEPDTDTEE